MRLKRIDKTYKHFQRYQNIFSILFKYGFEDIIDRLKLKDSLLGRSIILKSFVKEELKGLNTNQRIRLALQELGPTFIKLGQFLSLRPDLIGAELSEELELLQDHVEPFGFNIAVNIIEKELNSKKENCFKIINEEPLAVASISQVHKAKLKNGKDVIIKIQRPGIENIIFTDLEILSDISRIAQKYIEELQNFDLPGIVEEAFQAMKKELDFLWEAQNIAKFKKLYQNDDIYVPEIFWECTKEKILTIEFIDGFKANNIKKIKEMNIDPKDLAKKCIASLFKQIYINGFFHADPHPGNVLIKKDGKIAFIDYGIMGKLNEQDRIYLIKLFSAIMERDIEKIIYIFRNMELISEETKIPLLKAKIGDMIDKYYNIPINQIKISKIAKDFFDSARVLKLKVPADFALMGKSIVALESLIFTLDPQFQIEKISESLFSDVISLSMNPRIQYNRFKKYFASLLEVSEKFPIYIQSISEKLSKGKFSLNIEHNRLQELISEIDRASNRIAFGLIVASLIIGSSLLVQSSVGPKLFNLPILGILGYSIAGLLGLWLIFNIIKSKNL